MGIGFVCLYVDEIVVVSFCASTASWSYGDLPQIQGVRFISLEDVKQCTNNFAEINEIGIGGYGKVSSFIFYVRTYLKLIEWVV